MFLLLMNMTIKFICIHIKRLFSKFHECWILINLTCFYHAHSTKLSCIMIS